MSWKEILSLFQEKPYYLRMGNENIASRLHTTVDKVVSARKIYRAMEKKKASSRMPKILILDIETAPLKAFIFNLWKQNITIDKIISDWFCICWSAKWLMKPEIMWDCVNPNEAINEDDSRILGHLRELLNEADIVVTHNGDRFDLPKINTRLLLNGFTAPTPYQSIDTCRIVKNQFSFASNKLDFLATKFNLPNKLETNFELWVKCVEGDEYALKEMVKYNQYDVELLENVYLRLRPWIKNHPNLGLYMEAMEKVCPNCGSTHLTLESHYYTNTNKYEVYRCKCGALSRVRTPITTKETRDNLLNNNLR